MQTSGMGRRRGAPVGCARIADRGFARRQRALLEGLLGHFRSDFTRALELMLTELEQQIFRGAEQARSNEVQRALLEAQKQIHANRALLAPAMLDRIEDALATLTDPPEAEVVDAARPQFSELALVDTGAMDETVALREIATRAEIRNSLPLFLLGQRLGVVAGRPAFDAERLPIGPRRLCEILRECVDVLGLDSSQRSVVFGQYDRSVMQFFGEFLETLNNHLIQQKILPHLTYVAPRSKTPQRRREAPVALPDSKPESGPPAEPKATPETAVAHAPVAPGMFPPAGGRHAPPSHPSHPQVARGAPAGTPTFAGKGLFPPPSGAAARAGGSPGNASRPPATTAPADALARTAAGEERLPWSGRPTQAPDAPPAMEGSVDVALFDTLRRLLAGRRSLLERLQTNAISGPVASPAQVQDSLSALQARHNAQWAKGIRPALGDMRRELSAHLAAHASGGRIPQLSGVQGDTVDLVGMLFEQISQEVQPATPGGQLLGQLQLPLLRVAMQDQNFFSDSAHPARQLLTTITETSAYWSSEDEVDRDLVQKMGTVVRQVCENPNADEALFRQLVDDLGSHLSTQQRRAEVAERRHVEAARGREKLEIARLKAEEAIDGLITGKPVPKFLKTLLEQVWTDVLALALLRGGDDAPAFRQYLGLAETLVAAALPNENRVLLKPLELTQIRTEVEAALAQVGHTGDEARDFSSRLIAVVSGEAEPADKAIETSADPASRTELTLKLRNRARLGEDVRSGGGERQPAKTDKAEKVEKAAPLTAAEKAWHNRLQRIAFGTWFDFTINQQGVKARRRLSWYSTVTDHCLFVNHRGQRAGDYTLSWLAREINRGNVSLVEPESGSIVDRAWKAIVSTLRSFSGGAATAPAAT